MMKYLHTMVRVGDLDRSIRFYTEVLGLVHHRTTDYPDGKFSLTFLGYGGDSEPFLELTYNYGVSEYEHGGAYGHMAFAGKVTRPPGPMKHGKTVLAFIEDPDGYKVELIERRG